MTYVHFDKDPGTAFWDRKGRLPGGEEVNQPEAIAEAQVRDAAAGPRLARQRAEGREVGENSGQSISSRVGRGG